MKVKIDFSRPITNLKDVTIKRQTENADGERGSDEDMTLGWVCIQGLLAPQRGLTDEKEKLSRGRLAMKIFPEGVIEITVDEFTKMKRLVGETQPTWWVTRAAELLEQPYVEPSKQPAVETQERESND